MAALLILGFLSLASLCRAEISHSTINLDSRTIILFDTFGFSKTGHIDMNVSEVQVFVSDGKKPANKALMGFFITTAAAELKLEEDLMAGRCVLDDPNVQTLFTLHDAENGRDPTSGVFPYKFYMHDAQEYSLFFANCQGGHSVVSLDVVLSLYNVEASGMPDYLPAGKTELPALFFTFFLAYLVALGGWIYICFLRKSFVHRIHLLMGVLLLFKALTVLSQAGEYAYIKATGAPQGWNVAFYVFSFLRGIMLFTVIVLIGTGWSFLKPFLQDREKKVIMIVIPLQVLANLATIILDETGPSSREWFTWRDIFHLVDIVCCCAILFPIVWSIKQLREASHTDGKAARTLVKLTLFRQFYVMVVCYIYFTRIIVYLLKSTTPYHFAWTADLAAELVTLLFYCVTGFLFRPVEHNPYLHLDDEEEEAAAQALRDDDFEL